MRRDLLARIIHEKARRHAPSVSAVGAQSTTADRFAVTLFDSDFWPLAPGFLLPILSGFLPLISVFCTSVQIPFPFLAGVIDIHRLQFAPEFDRAGSHFARPHTGRLNAAEGKLGFSSRCAGIDVRDA